MTRQTVQPEKRKRGPKPTGVGTPVQVRLQPADLAALDAFRTAGESMTRPQAIRAVLADWLRTQGYASPPSKKPHGPATKVVKGMDAAMRKIENLCRKR